MIMHNTHTISKTKEKGLRWEYSVCTVRGYVAARSPIALKYSHLINSCFETLMQFADDSDKNEEQQAHDRYSIPFQRYVWMTCTARRTQRTKFNMNAHYCSQTVVRTVLSGRWCVVPCHWCHCTAAMSKYHWHSGMAALIFKCSSHLQMHLRTCGRCSSGTSVSSFYTTISAVFA